MTCLANYVEANLLPRHRPERSAHSKPNDSRADATGSELKDDIRSALSFFDPDDYAVWIANGQRLKHLLNGFEVWLEWSAGSSKFDQREAEEKWATFTADRTGYAAIFAEAQRLGWTNPAQGYWVNVPILPAVLAFSARFQARYRASASDGAIAAWFSADELRNKQFDPVEWVVPSIIPQGAIIFAGRPKLGKSWIALDTGIAVAEGGTTFGKKCAVGDVLYAALEDTQRRLKNRMWKLKGNADWPVRLKFLCELPRANEGGIELVRNWIEQADNPRLVIIDTLALVRQGKGRDEQNYDADYRAVTPWKQLADEYNIAVILVHHVRKLAAEDPLEMISGTNGITGAADAVLVLNRSSQGCTLGGRGRDLEEFELSINFDPQSCRWSVLGNSADVQRSNEPNLVIELLDASPSPLSPASISERLSRSKDSVRQMLLRMVEAGEIIKSGRGLYTTPGHHSHNVTSTHTPCHNRHNEQLL